MREGAKPRLELEERGRNPLVYVGIACVVMFIVAIVLFVVLVGDRPGDAAPDSPPPASAPP